MIIIPGPERLKNHIIILQRVEKLQRMEIRQESFPILESLSEIINLGLVNYGSGDDELNDYILDLEAADKTGKFQDNIKFTA